MARIIILDDSRSGSAFLKMSLMRHRYQVRRTADIHAVIAPQPDSVPHLVLINHAFANQRGWEIFNYLKRMAGHIPIMIYVLAHVNAVNASGIVEAVRTVLG